jgi:hypothetical protein
VPEPTLLMWLGRTVYGRRILGTLTPRILPQWTHFQSKRFNHREVIRRTCLAATSGLQRTRQPAGVERAMGVGLWGTAGRTFARQVLTEDLGVLGVGGGVWVDE